jgi:hypothetical protein
MEGIIADFFLKTNRQSRAVFKSFVLMGTALIFGGDFVKLSRRREIH